MVRTCDICGEPIEYRGMYCPKCNPDALSEGVSKGRLREALVEIEAGCRWPISNTCATCRCDLNPYCNEYSKIARKALEEE